MCALHEAGEKGGVRRWRTRRRRRRSPRLHRSARTASRGSQPRRGFRGRLSGAKSVKSRTTRMCLKTGEGVCGRLCALHEAGEKGGTEVADEEAAPEETLFRPRGWGIGTLWDWNGSFRTLVSYRPSTILTTRRCGSGKSSSEMSGLLPIRIIFEVVLTSRIDCWCIEPLKKLF